MGRAGAPPPQVRPQLFNDSHLRGHWPGDGVARPGLLWLTSYFQRFGKRWYLASWLQGAGQMRSWGGGACSVNWGVQRRPPDSELSTEETDQRHVACLLEASGDLGQILARSEPQFPHRGAPAQCPAVTLHMIMWLLPQMSLSPKQGDRILFPLKSLVILRIFSVFPGGYCESQDDPSYSGKDTLCCSGSARGSLRAPTWAVSMGDTPGSAAPTWFGLYYLLGPALCSWGPL